MRWAFVQRALDEISQVLRQIWASFDDLTGRVKKIENDDSVDYSTLTDGYLPNFDSATDNLENSPAYTDGTNVGIGQGTTAPARRLEVAVEDSSGTSVSYPLRITHRVV